MLNKTKNTKFLKKILKYAYNTSGIENKGFDLKIKS